MKSTGIVRKIDAMGRVVIPRECRRILEIDEGDGLEIFVEGTNIILHKYSPSCIFCGDSREVSSFKGRLICSKCYNELRQ